MTSADWSEVARIYAEGMATGIATFETTVPQYASWDQGHLPYGRLVAESEKGLDGWAALSPVSGRCVYGGVAEVSIYIAAKSRGKGVGFHLMEQLITESEKAGIWTLQSGIFPENTPSIRLHEKSGFRFLGIRKRIARKDGIWKDNVLYERRSEIVGVD